MLTSPYHFGGYNQFNVGVIWDLSVKRTGKDTCELANTVIVSSTPQLLELLAKQSIPWDVFKAMNTSAVIAHNTQEAPFFAKSIERHALKSN